MISTTPPQSLLKAPTPPTTPDWQQSVIPKRSVDETSVLETLIEMGSSKGRSSKDLLKAVTQTLKSLQSRSSSKGQKSRLGPKTKGQDEAGKNKAPPATQAARQRRRTTALRKKRKHRHGRRRSCAVSRKNSGESETTESSTDFDSSSSYSD